MGRICHSDWLDRTWRRMRAVRQIRVKPIAEPLVRRFRAALEEAVEDAMLSLPAFDKFPRGCCGDASDLLARYLLESGIRTSGVSGTFRSAGFESAQTHMWLIDEDGLIIDITGDQFRFNPLLLNYSEPVYYGPEDDFHRLFEIDGCNINVGEFERYNNPARNSLIEAYSALHQYI